MKKILSTLWSNEFYQGGVVLTAGSFIVNFLNYLFNFFAAKSLGPKGFGEITALISYLSIFSLPFTILATIIIQKISAAGIDRKTYAVLLEDLFVSKLKKMLFFCIPFIFFIPLFPQLTNLSPLSSYNLILLTVLSFFSSFYLAANQGLRLFFLATLTAVGAVILKSAGSFLTYVGIGDITLVQIFLFLSTLFSTIATYFIFHRNTIQKIHSIRKRIEKSVVSILFSRQFLIFSLSVAGISLFGTIDIIFVKKFFSPEIAGIYSSWSLFSKIILYAVGPFISISFIFFSSAETKLQQKNTLLVSIVVLLFIGIISYFLYTNFASILIAIFFGARFNAVMHYLRLASIFGSLYTALTFINNYFLSRKSVAALILPLGLPFYIITLFMIPKQIEIIMQTTILFSLLVIIIYCLYFLIKYLLRLSQFSN
jgi:O-antigen/teichoic acid export membrane protein